MIPAIFPILIKFTLTISVMTVFYKVFLEKLTFFHGIRYYFLSGILIAFSVPLLKYQLPVKNIPTWTTSRVSLIQTDLFQQITTGGIGSVENVFDIKQFLCALYVLGLLILVLKLILQMLSFYNLKSAGHRLQDHANIYMIDQEISPFSFLNHVFVPKSCIDSEKLEKILAHEFIHIRQRHTFDMILAEIVCILNWFNPLAWVLKKSIRQNLEYIADDIMLSRGIDLKAYQYLLLQTLGHPPYSLATSFSFHSLKSRINMMNQHKSNPWHRLRFLLLLPIALLLIFAFRTIPHKQLAAINDSNPVQDTVKPNFINKEGFANNGTFTYQPGTKDHIFKRIEVNTKGENAIATVLLKNGSKEIYNLNKEEDAEKFQEKYGDAFPPTPPLPPAPPLLAAPPMPALLAMPPSPPMPALADLPPAPSMPALPSMPPAPALPPLPPTPDFSYLDGVEIPNASISINHHTITIKLSNGEIEKYDMKDEHDKKKFEEKYRK